MTNTQPKKQPRKYNASRDFAQGITWAVLMRWSMRFIGLFSTLILARVLSPTDFGIAAMGMLVVHLLYELSEFGTSMHLIRSKEIDRSHCDTAWTVTLLQGLFTSLLLLLLASPASLYFNEPRVINVMYMLALASFVGGFENIGPVLLRREFRFAQDYRFNVFKKALVFLTTVGCALYFRNYWALVFGHLAGTFAGVALSYVVHPYRPRWSLSRGREYFHFALSIIPLRLANTLRGMISSFFVAGLGNASTLGAYRVAGDLASTFTKEIVTPMGRGLLPNYSRLADQPSALSAMYRKVLAMVAIICIPSGIGVAAVAPDLVLVLLGPQWELSAKLLQYLAIGSVVYAISQAMNNQILVATGREKAAAVLAWIRLAITVPILWLGLEYGGVVGLAKASIVAPIACLPFIFNETRRAVDFPVGVLVALLWRPTTSAIIMYFAIKALHIPTLDWAILRLALDASMGAAIFVATILSLWFISGRPDGAERIVMGLVANAWSKARDRFGKG